MRTVSLVTYCSADSAVNAAERYLRAVDVFAKVLYGHQWSNKVFVVSKHLPDNEAYALADMAKKDGWRVLVSLVS